MSADILFAQFVEAYPPSRRQRGYIAQQLFLAALDKVSWQTLIDAVEQHKRSVQWQANVIPSMTTWLQEERWIQILPEPERALTPWQTARRLGYK